MNPRELSIALGLGDTYGIYVAEPDSFTSWIRFTRRIFSCEDLGVLEDIRVELLESPYLLFRQKCDLNTLVYAQRLCIKYGWKIETGDL